MFRLLWILFFFIAFNCYSQTVSLSEANSAAETWFQIVSKNDDVKIKNTHTYDYNKITSLYIIEFDPIGFVLLSAQKNCEPILGYSVSNKVSFPIDSTVIKWFNHYSEQIEYINQTNYSNKKNQNKWKTLINNDKKDLPELNTIIEPLLKTKWNQGEDWNDFCPADPDGPGGHAWVGCVAVPMAQVMKYWEYPTYGSSDYSYVHENYGNIGVNFNHHGYTYQIMPNDYPNDEIRKLLFHCGVAIKMNYGPESSIAYSSRDVGFAMKNYFNFSTKIYCLKREDYSLSIWLAKIKTELDNERPIIYNGFPENDIGHSFNIDGYDNEDMFHINWGWGGIYDGYYSLDDLTPGNHDYSYYQNAYFNIYPDIPEKVNSFDLQLNENNEVELSWEFVSNSLCATYARPMESTHVWNVGWERATFYSIYELNQNQIIELNTLAHTFYDFYDDPPQARYFTFRIYASDGSTVLYESPSIAANANCETVFTLQEPLTISTDFYVSIVPESPTDIYSWGKRIVMDQEPLYSYIGSAGNWTLSRYDEYGYEWITSIYYKDNVNNNNRNDQYILSDNIGANIYRNGSLHGSTFNNDFTDLNPINGTNSYYVKTFLGTVDNESEPSNILTIDVDNITPVIFIPGIMGSSLFDDTDGDNRLEENELIWLNTSKLVSSPNDSFLDALRLMPDGETSWDSDYNIKPAPLRNDPNRTLYDELFGNNATKPSEYYKMFFYELISEGYELEDSDTDFSEGENLFYFPYDWRKSNVSNAAELNDFIENLTSKSGNDKVNLVVHSMGGLLTKQYIRIYGSDKIKKLIFIGTPHLGAPKIYYSLLTGGLTADFKDYCIYGDQIIKISLNMPSSYQLFPFQNYFSTSINNGSSSHSQLYSSSFQNISGFDLNYNGINEYFKNAVLPNGWQFNSDMIDDKSNFQSYLTNISFGETELYNIVGYGTETISLVKDKMIGNRHSPYLKFDLTGDGTVPLRSAEIINNEVLEHTYYIPNVDHLNLTSDENVLTIIKGLLSDPAITSFPDYASPPASYASDEYLSAQVACPVALSVYDSQGRHTGPTSGNEWETEIPGSQYIPGDLNDPYAGKIIVLPKGNNYTFEITSLNAEDDFNLYFDENVEGEQISFAAFENVQFDQYSKAKISFSSINDDILLDLDINGDGNYEESISPTQITSVIERGPEVPKDFKLVQNYPNPFNPTTTIIYDLPKESTVKLKVFNSIGKEIRTLVNERQNAGRYTIDFDGSNLSSGVYYYSLTAGEYREVRKMVLLK